MFIRSIKVRSSAGNVHEYVRVVSSVRENGKVKQKVVANLGRRDTLEAVLPLLNRFLLGEGNQHQLARELAQEGSLEVVDAGTWGPMLVTRHLFQQLGLFPLLDAGRRWPKLRPEEDPDDDWPSRVLALLTNRLTEPESEHGLAGWLENHYIIDRLGRRYVPCWKEKGRVKVDMAQLQRWYRTLDHLVLNKDKIEVALYQRLRDLFDFQPDLVLYDLTSTYFEGLGPSIAKHGHSRDGKPRKVQVIVGVVMVAGWPIAHHVWAGNTRDSTTVKEVIEDLTKRFDFRRVVFVGDRGMVTESNLETVQDADGDWGFLLGMNRRRNPEAETLIDRVSEDAGIHNIYKFRLTPSDFPAEFRGEAIGELPASSGPNGTGEDEREVDVCQKNFVLLAESELKEGWITLPLAEVRADGTGHFIYDPGFIPPCLQIVASPRMMLMLERLVEMLEAKVKSLKARTLGSGAGLAELASHELTTFWFTHSREGFRWRS